MKPAGDAVMADYADHPTKLVADVDCAPPRREGRREGRRERL